MACVFANMADGNDNTHRRQQQQEQQQEWLRQHRLFLLPGSSSSPFLRNSEGRDYDDDGGQNEQKQGHGQGIQQNAWHPMIQQHNPSMIPHHLYPFGAATGSGRSTADAAASAAASSLLETMYPSTLTSSSSTTATTSTHHPAFLYPQQQQSLGLNSSQSGLPLQLSPNGMPYSMAAASMEITRRMNLMAATAASSSNPNASGLWNHHPLGNVLALASSSGVPQGIDMADAAAVAAHRQNILSSMAAAAAPAAPPGEGWGSTTPTPSTSPYFHLAALSGRTSASNTSNPTAAADDDDDDAAGGSDRFGFLPMRDNAVEGGGSDVAAASRVDDEDATKKSSLATKTKRKSVVRTKSTTKKTAASKLVLPPPRRSTMERVAQTMPIVLYTEDDDAYLTPYQCLLRKQLELFEAGPEDVRSSSQQGRTTNIQVGQVGLRCRHCTGGLASRTKGALYYSHSIDGVYQIGQNIGKVHLTERCYRIPDDIRRKLIALRSDSRRASSGKIYWSDRIRRLGVYEEGSILRFRPPHVSLSSSSEPTEGKEDEGEKKDQRQQKDDDSETEKTQRF